jgi:hypothetical protein
MFAKLAATAVAVSALVLPSAAFALQEGSSGSGHTAPVVAVPSNPRLDGKYLPVPAPARTAPAPVQIVRVVKPSGFDFRDASIGAAFGALLIAIVGTLILVSLRERGPRVATGA